MERVYWITGLSGAGKTTIGKRLYEKLKEKQQNIVFLDGDTLRTGICDDLGYSEADRRICALRYSKLCKMLAQQNILVVICTISMFHEVRKWNRENIPDYVEIYVKVSLDTLHRRDQKGLYSRTSNETESTVSGVDFEFEEPLNPDLVLLNDGDFSPDEQVVNILEYKVSER